MFVLSLVAGWFFGSYREKLLLHFLFGFFVTVLREKAPKNWRPFHTLIYVASLLGIVHANFSRSNFQEIGIVVIFEALFVASVGVFTYKRCRNYPLKRNAIRR